jgi:hypothetical protein
MDFLNPLPNLSFFSFLLSFNAYPRYDSQIRFLPLDFLELFLNFPKFYIQTLVPALVKELQSRGGDHIKVVCGGVIPPKDYDELRRAGVVAIFGPGTRITMAALEVMAKL